jgi:hypothetical protein
MRHTQTMLNDNNIRLGWSSTGRGSNLPLGQTPHGDMLIFLLNENEFGEWEQGRRSEGWGRGGDSRCTCAYGNHTKELPALMAGSPVIAVQVSAAREVKGSQSGTVQQHHKQCCNWLQRQHVIVKCMHHDLAGFHFVHYVAPHYIVRMVFVEEAQLDRIDPFEFVPISVVGPFLRMFAVLLLPLLQL